MKCFFHKSDLDGHCSGAIIKLQYPRCEMIGVDYKDTIKSLGVVIQPCETVYVVDFRFSMADMKYLNEICVLYWIDHHKTSIDEARLSGFQASGEQSLEVGKAGCELTWDYIHGRRPQPLAVRLLGRYDVWDHTDFRTLPFQFGMREIENTYPGASFWEDLFTSNIGCEDIMLSGDIILRYQEKQNKMYAKGMAYEREFEGFRAIVMNKAYINSKAFDSVYDPEKHDIMVNFGFKPGDVKYSLWCDKPEIDVSEIAKRYGGGGHKGAAGFYSDKILDEFL